MHPLNHDSAISNRLFGIHRANLAQARTRRSLFRAEPIPAIPDPGRGRVLSGASEVSTSAKLSGPLP
jgi:hypothetical protein